jgi:hypothetical protein
MHDIEDRAFIEIKRVGYVADPQRLIGAGEKFQHRKALIQCRDSFKCGFHFDGSNYTL